MVMDMNVSLSEELAAYVEAKVSTGDYGSSSEVVREALRLMAKAERDGTDIAQLRQAWEDGKSSGIFGEIDFEALRAEGKERLKVASRAAERAG